MTVYLIFSTQWKKDIDRFHALPCLFNKVRIQEFIYIWSQAFTNTNWEFRILYRWNKQKANLRNRSLKIAETSLPIWILTLFSHVPSSLCSSRTPTQFYMHFSFFHACCMSYFSPSSTCTSKFQVMWYTGQFINPRGTYELPCTV